MLSGSGMERILIFGNSGSGKSTLASRLAGLHNARHLDLDTIAWLADRPGVRMPLDESIAELKRFIESCDDWVIEGCYSDLLREAAVFCTEMIFLNPGVEACVENCLNRPWEPHKYESPEAQDANLRLLIDWVREYETRQDEFSLSEHRRLFDRHSGRKAEYRSNEDTAAALRTILG